MVDTHTPDLRDCWSTPKVDRRTPAAKMRATLRAAATASTEEAREDARETVAALLACHPDLWSMLTAAAWHRLHGSK